MIQDADDTLRELVNREILNGSTSQVDVSFETPTSEWAAKRQGSVLNLYLYDIREDLERRRVQFEEVRNEQGRVVDRRMPPRKFRLSYLATAWTARPEDEHRLLSAALACFTSFDAVPADMLQGGLAELDESVRVTVGIHEGDGPGASDVWLGLSAEMKPSLAVMVTTPIPPKTPRELWIGPEVTETPRISLLGSDGESEHAGSGRRAGAADEAGNGAGGAEGGDARVGGDGADGAASGEGEGADGARPGDGDAEPEEVFHGGKPETREGRHFTIRTMPRR